MAAPVRQRPGRYLAFVALVLVGLYLGVFLGPSATPSLGLDLRGGIQVTLKAEPIRGGTITKDDLNQAVNIIRQRVNGLGASGAEVHTQGGSNIVVSIPGATNRREVLDTVGETALLRFRQVLQAANGVPAPVTTPTATTSPSPGKGKGGTATPKATQTSKAGNKKGKQSNGDAVRAALLAKPKKSPSPTPSTVAVTPTPAGSPTPTVSASPPNASDTGASSKPDKGSEAPTLTPALQQSFQKWDCSKDSNPTNGSDLSTDYIIACEPSTGSKYLLGPAALQGTDVSTASANINQTGGWVVDLKFTGHGSSAWLALTRKTYEVTNSGESGFNTGCSPPKGCNAIGIVLDGVVQSAPATQTDGIPGGNTEISGNFTHETASQLANVLKYGSLPLKFSVPTATQVSPTLGSTQLHGGLVAGVIGLALVILFSLLYYRALGLVTVGSLAVSGLILYAVTTLLGHSSVGYTLSLPGIAGFIVAVGITADSFVVFFERIRDEIREGRRLRSAIDRGWPRARRTILSADTVSLLAAFVLYVVSIGDVRGFAFTLGISTLSDLFIVFFFTKPLLMVLAKSKAFDSGKKWTGIGQVRAGVARDASDRDRARRTRTREA
ncbi:MAG: protein translocase subunit SecD [Frankiaceae bacterium]|nr:protein translocase subunit SecD [Frankiaceae bacterium]